MNWNNLTSIDELEKWDKESYNKPVLIFKHSTRCMTSKMVLSRVERTWKDGYNTLFTPLFLDLIAFRDVSNTVANKYNITHESPQAILISDGKSIYNASHTSIDLEDIAMKTQ